MFVQSLQNYFQLRSFDKLNINFNSYLAFDHSTASAVWDFTLPSVFAVDPTGNHACLRAEAGSWPFGKNSLPRPLPCLHPFCQLSMSLAAPTGNTNTQRPSRRLQVSSPSLHVPSLRWLVGCQCKGCCRVIRLALPAPAASPCCSRWLDKHWDQHQGGARRPKNTTSLSTRTQIGCNRITTQIGHGDLYKNLALNPKDYPRGPLALLLMSESSKDWLLPNGQGNRHSNRARRAGGSPSRPLPTVPEQGRPDQASSW